MNARDKSLAPAFGRSVIAVGARDWQWALGVRTLSTGLNYEYRTNGPHRGQADANPPLSREIRTGVNGHVGNRKDRMHDRMHNLDPILHRLRVVLEANQLAPDDERLLKSAIKELEELKSELDVRSINNALERRAQITDVVVRVCWMIAERWWNG